MKPIPFSRRISTRLFAVLLGLLLLTEVILRGVGLVLTEPSDLRNLVSSEDDTSLRILALGESTTADYFADNAEGAWPRQLEQKLRRRGITARVYNEGIGGTTSSLILAHLTEYLERYKPEIVISMMGINDSLFIYSGPPSKLREFFLNIRLIRILRWAISAVRQSLVCKLDESQFDPEREALVGFAFQLAAKHSLSEVEKELVKRGLTRKQVAEVFTDVSMKFRGDFSTEDNKAQTEEYILRAFEVYPMHAWIAFNAIQDFGGNPKCLEMSKKILACGTNLSDGVLAQVLGCFENFPDQKLPSFVEELGIRLSTDAKNVTTHNYRLLAAELRRRSIKYIAMQYPTLPVVELQARFHNAQSEIDSQYREISFISNEANFIEALKSNKYEKVFLDKFRGSWGHTTELGHGLISESALKAVLTYLKKGH